MNSNELIDRLVETFVRDIEKAAAAGNHVYVCTGAQFTETLKMINDTINLECQLYMLSVNSCQALVTVAPAEEVTYDTLIAALKLRFPDCIISYETQLINSVNVITSIHIDWS
jgi:hypothetical protein